MNDETFDEFNEIMIFAQIENFPKLLSKSPFIEDVLIISARNIAMINVKKSIMKISEKRSTLQCFFHEEKIFLSFCVCAKH